MKKCPFCAEDIQDAAVKCRYCGSALHTADAKWRQFQSEFAALSPFEQAARRAQMSPEQLAKLDTITAPTRPPTPKAKSNNRTIARALFFFLAAFAVLVILVSIAIDRSPSPTQKRALGRMQTLSCGGRNSADTPFDAEASPAKPGLLPMVDVTFRKGRPSPEVAEQAVRD
jgi:hypothetical protein